MIWDILFVVGRPLGYLSGVLEIRTLIRTRIGKNRSLIAELIGFVIPLVTFARAWLSVDDLIFTLNALIGTILSGLVFVFVWKWRKNG